MTKHFAILAILICTVLPGFAQVDIKDYEGSWEGVLPSKHTFNFTVLLKKTDAKAYELSISNSEASFYKKITQDANGRLIVAISDHIHLNVEMNEDESMVNGLITSGILMYPIHLKKGKSGAFYGTWNPFMIDELRSQNVYISVEVYEDGNFATYPFFEDQRFTGTWTTGFTLNGNEVTFRDFKTGLYFTAELKENQMVLTFLLGEVPIAETDLKPSDTDWDFRPKGLANNQSTDKPGALDDGWETANLEAYGCEKALLQDLIETINAGELPNTQSVLIAKENKLIFEAYFEGFNANIPHDLRSASKSISSAMIGIAMDEGILKNVDQKLYDLLPPDYQYTKDARKAKISLKDLLTMSSGLDVRGKASEGAYQETDNWLKTVLEAPLSAEPGTRTLYGSANPYLLGIALNEQLDQALEDYMNQKLLAPLGISNFIIQTENTRSMPYFGGGMYLTPRDMLKFGQLYLNQGKWNGRQIISKKWVAESFQKHSQLEDARDRNKYGYQWWHHSYQVNGKEISTIEARGNGGQFIVVIPELEAVVVMTAGNYNNGKFVKQPENILADYVLPALNQ